MVAGKKGGAFAENVIEQLLFSTTVNKQGNCDVGLGFFFFFFLFIASAMMHAFIIDCKQHSQRLGLVELVLDYK